MISMSTETDRTLFFDFMPMELGTIGGQKVRVQLYTVPGQVFYDATRKLVLRGADGVVFVADSQPSMKESNIDSLENLKDEPPPQPPRSREDRDRLPATTNAICRPLQPVEGDEGLPRSRTMRRSSRPRRSTATGVTADAARGGCEMLDNLKNNVDTTLYDAAELRRPDLSVKSGVTASSAGTPKIGMLTPSGATSVSVPPPPRFEPEPGPEPPSFTPSTPFDLVEPAQDEDVPFGEVEPPDLAIPPVERSPFEHEDEAVAPEVDPFEPEPEAVAPAPVEANPFEPEADPFDTADSPPSDHDLFDATAPVRSVAEETPFLGASVPLEAAAIAGNSSDHGDLRQALAGARELVRQLEAALEAARDHERAIAEKLGE
jgi:hypothetical protein